MKFTIVLDMEEFSIKQIMYKPGKPNLTNDLAKSFKSQSLVQKSNLTLQV